MFFCCVVCCSSHSLPSLHIQRWEREIDWMALHGINLPLCLVGQEALWVKLWTSMGLSPDDLGFTGPAFLPWNRMGNVNLWDGPLSPSWMQAQLVLGQRIYARMVSLGMTPVLPAFAGHVPPALGSVYPNATLIQLSGWGGFNASYATTLLVPDADGSDLFHEIGSKFLKLVVENFGASSHVYSCDMWNELQPPSNASDFLRNTSAAVYDAMVAVDPHAIWLMQGWLFEVDPTFWTMGAIQSYLDGVPASHMLILDLWSDAYPVWARTQNFFGRSWIWCTLGNFGGNLGLSGDLAQLAELPFAALKASNGTMVGTGLTMEGINQNDVVYELATQVHWNPTRPLDVREWLPAYVQSRYPSAALPLANEGWQLLLETAYQQAYSSDGVLGYRPEWKPHSPPGTPNYNVTTMVQAWHWLYDAACVSLANAPGAHYDLVDVTREVMSNLFTDALQFAAVEAESVATMTLSILADLDAVLGTNEHFLLGRWLADAAASGGPSCVRNARNQIGLWGYSGGLNDYAEKQWNGMVGDYYAQRWSLYFGAVSAGNWTEERYKEAALALELAWSSRTDNPYPTHVSGDILNLLALINAKYMQVASAFTEVVHHTVGSNSTLLGSTAGTQDPGQLSWICQNLASCVAFTTDGRLYSTLSSPLIKSQSLNLYVKTGE